VARRIRLLSLLFSLAATSIVASGCAAEEDVDDVGESGSLEEPLTRVTQPEQTSASSESLGSLRYQHLTPTSEKVMKAARYWMRVQDKDPRYPLPRMCASNVAKVLFLAGIYGYDQEGVRNLVNSVAAAGGRTVVLPGTKKDLPAVLNGFDGGQIPAGTIIAGMHVSLSRPGDQHIGFIGHTDPDGTVWVYHNNWYRPESEGGVRKPFMVSDANLVRGYARQWMATPWIKVKRDLFGNISSVQSLMPQIDDMDPYNASYRVTLAIMPEVLRELPEAGR
jgi:hypothetical protein